jgi:uncharacterized protein YmfQ (DUF2313 family)
MLAPLYSVFDYLSALQRLLPRGRVWQRGWGSVQAQDLLTLMPQIVRLNERAIDVLAETFPCSTYELLPEWEATLGLPDPCIGEAATIQARQQAVCLKWSARGGQSIAYFEQLAASIGCAITIQTFRPFYIGQSRVDDRLFDEQWAYVWQVSTPLAGQVVYFRAGESTADEPLVAFGNAALECILNENKPAHTLIIYSYT